MKKMIMLALFLMTTSLFANNDDVWTAFYDEDASLLGFKDIDGNIKIEPKFMGFTSAILFRNIIAVMEDKGDYGYDTYYLLKSGKKVGKDSLYAYDNTADCEQEGFIRFKDHNTDLTGLFNSQGEVIIPAEYAYLSRVCKGLLFAVKGADKDTSDPYSEYTFWNGGVSCLIDTNNKILVKNIDENLDINYFSVQIGDTPNNNKIRKNYLGADDKYYSFINYPQEFRQWFFEAINDNMSKQTLINNSYDNIFYWNKSEEWTKKDSKSFINIYYDVISDRLSGLNNEYLDYSMNTGLLEIFVDDKSLGKYFNDCGEHFDEKYPLLQIVINHQSSGEFKQDIFEFLRTDEGYKLINISIADAEFE